MPALPNEQYSPQVGGSGNADDAGADQGDFLAQEVTRDW
jgi:hypothetical protein